MGLSHGIAELADYDLFRSQAVFLNQGLYSQGGVVDSWSKNTTNSPTSSSSSSCLCQNNQGWGPASQNQFSLTPCFVEGVVMNLPNLLLVTLGLYQITVLVKNKPVLAKIDWRLFSKMVCHSLFHYEFFFFC
jgi:hypothetical protein